jgi:molybdopterin synthase sulfur carrier subunit
MDTPQVATEVMVRLPAALLERTGQRARVPATGATVREVIASLERDFPGLLFRLCEETGELRPHVNIFVEGENIRYMEMLDTAIPPGATIFILPSVSGG